MAVLMEEATRRAQNLLISSRDEAMNMFRDMADLEKKFPRLVTRAVVKDSDIRELLDLVSTCADILNLYWERFGDLISSLGHVETDLQLGLDFGWEEDELNDVDDIGD